MDFQELKKQLKEYKRIKGYEKITANQIFALQRKFVEEATECARCGRREWLSLDHIVPFSLLEQLGVDMKVDDDDENWQILCRPCNVFKANRLDFTNPKTKEILLRYINKI